MGIPSSNNDYLKRFRQNPTSINEINRNVCGKYAVHTFSFMTGPKLAIKMITRPNKYR